MKETLSTILAILQEFRRDTKAASIIVLFGLLGGSLWLVYVQVNEKNDLAANCEEKLENCQAEYMKYVKEMDAKLFNAVITIDSINRAKTKNRK